jgi:hypothetical protein
VSNGPEHAPAGAGKVAAGGSGERRGSAGCSSQFLRRPPLACAVAAASSSGKLRWARAAAATCVSVIAAPPQPPAADFGFDPLGLGKNETALKWYTQAELQNGRWAMLGVAGILVQVRTLRAVCTA